MSVAKRSGKERGKASEPLISEKKMRVDDNMDADLDLSRFVIVDFVGYCFGFNTFEF